MRKRLLEQDADSLYDHELLEMMLYYSIPRGDTNVIAHRLLHHFGRLHHVLEAQLTDLLEIEGIGEASALQIILTFEMVRRYRMDLADAVEKRIDAHNAQALGKFFVERLGHCAEERILLACLDGQGRIKNCYTVTTGTPSASDLQTARIAEIALRTRAVCVILGHNHPHGFVTPSVADVRTTYELRKKLDGIGVTLVEHVVVSEDSYLMMSDFQGLF